MEIVYWIIIAVLFIGSFAGILFPVFPSVILLWLSFIIYQLGIAVNELNAFFWLAMIVFTLILISADLIANSYFVKKFGASKIGERVAAIAVIIGSFITPPFGIIYVPFIAVFLVEMLQKRSFKEAWKASIGSLIGFLSGSAAKVIIQLLMIVWFFILVIF